MATSCTDALEMAAILCDIKSGDEGIVPSYTFVSSALAFVRQVLVLYLQTVVRIIRILMQIRLKL